ncbi:MAG: DNA-methyltransferase [Phycisphaerae bacterium]
MKDAIDRVHQTDCLEGLASLEAESVDLAFADPPFNIGYAYDQYDDRQDRASYLDWSRRWIGAVYRILKPDGAFWLAIGDEYAAELKLIAQNTLPELSIGDAGFHCRSWVIWYYTFGVHCNRKFTRSHAHLFHFVKDPRQFTFNGDAVRVPSARQLVYADKRANPNGRVPDDTWMIPPHMPDAFALRPQDIPGSFRPDDDVWCFSRVAGTFRERQGWHGCQMPEQLLGRILRACSNEGDCVLDPFTGSGTTLVVAKKLGRRFVGFEVSDNYANEARRRLAATQKGEALNGSADPVISGRPTGYRDAHRAARHRRHVQGEEETSLFG